MARFVFLLVVVGLASLPLGAADATLPVPVRTLDGSGNNVTIPRWGKAGIQYTRVAAANYGDGVASMPSGPPSRYVSNRVFNDVGQNVFSENGVSQWAWAWGQFLDHDFGLRDETPAESAPIAFNSHDPLEEFQNDFGAIGFARTPAAPNTGVTTPRQQINTISSYIDASNVYGVTKSRDEWLRDGPVDGILSNNAATLMLPNGYLPRVTERGDAASAPSMDLMGALMGTPDKAVVAGDVRANENIALTAIHTMMAREHNRIVAALPTSLSEADRFEIARRVVAAEEQYITYNEFLPAVGVKLPAYQGYNPNVNATLSNEFAVVGYRAHSMIHGEFDIDVEADTYTPAQLDAFRAAGITVKDEGDGIAIVVPLGIAFGNPDLLEQLGLGQVLQSLGNERQYKNDEQIDNSLRSVLFQVPKPGIPDPRVCGEPVVNPDCYTGVQDLGALDIERGRDHGMPSYNAMRVAYGLAPKTYFTQITGESTSSFPSDPAIDSADPINDPSILDFRVLRDAGGDVIPFGTAAAQENAVTGVRRTTLAARLRAIYGSVDNVDAFVGMVAEPHVAGTEFGELQLAIWKKQFQALRDGDRFFYLNDPYLTTIAQTYGIDYKRTLADLITANTGADVQADVFHAPLPPTAVHLNAGGGTYASAGGANFLADTYFNGGSTYSTTASISGTSDPALYQNERFSQFSYAIPVVNGTYDVRLHFSEIWFGTSAPGCSGKRVFSVDVADTAAKPDIANLDICARVGPRTALIRTIKGVTVTDGVLGINWIPGIENPEVGAVEVIPAGTPDTTSPAVSITAPAAGATLAGTTTVTADASDDVGVSSVQFKLDGAALGAPDTAAPYSIGWDTTTAANGPHTLTAVAKDAAGNATTSSESAVTVANLAPPVVLLGDQQVEPAVDKNNAGMAEAFPTTAAASGTLQTISVYVDGTSGATRLVVGLYTDGGDGHPSVVLTQAAMDAPKAGWVTVAVPAVQVTAGTGYWIAILGTGGTLRFRDRCCGAAGNTPTENSAETLLTELPTMWSTGTVWPSGAPLSAFGTS